MLSQLSEQAMKSSQPASDLLAANVKILQTVSKQQADLVSGMLGDSMKLMQSLGQQTEVKGLLAAQTVYAESVRERITATSKHTYSTLTAAGQQFADTLKTSFDAPAASPATKPVAKKASVKKPVAKKAPAKSAAKSAATSTAKTKVSATAKAEPVAKKTTIKADAVVAKKAVAPAKAKKVAKPLPTLSADSVRATPKQAASEAATTPSDAS
jgi:phasin family protein